MPYPVINLISEAFYTSGIVSRQFNQVEGDQIDTGLTKLNEILTDTQIEDDMIPYFTTAYNFPAVIGQESYFIPGLVEAETLTFFINTIRYQMRKNTKDIYFGSGRAQNVLSLPYNWIAERCFGGHNLFLYFFPDVTYPMQLTGLFRLQSVALYQDLASTLTTANLGICTVSGAGTLGLGEFVVNGVDLNGTYATPAALVAHINTGVIPGVTAVITGLEFSLYSQANTSILITTLGTEAFLNNITFSNFSTLNGPYNFTFMPQSLDQFYINYLQYALADRLCTSYNFQTPPGVVKQLLKYEQAISNRSAPMDLSIAKISTLTKGDSINYAQVNLGHGWTT